MPKQSGQGTSTLTDRVLDCAQVSSGWISLVYFIAVLCFAATASAQTPGEPGSASEAPSDATASAEPPPEIVVRGRTPEAQRLRGSAEAVTVVDTLYARQQSRDLADVLSGVEGVVVRRAGGLGSLTRFSLNGLSDNQIRFFFDGIPLDIAGSPFGLSSVPVNAIERVEIHRGVVPVRLGADALGGAVNLVPYDLRSSNVYLSYQRGSFGTHRASASARYHHAPSGVVVGLSGMFDVARNDYEVDVEVADKTGRVSPARVRRFHGRYGAYGGSASVAVLDKPWAKRLSLQLFGLSYDKEVQHDAVMTQPFGEVEYGATSFGATARYEHSITKTIGISAVANGGRQTLRFLDESEWVYDWFGNRVGKRSRPGELSKEPHDATIWQDSGFGRVTVEWQAHPEHVLRAATTLRYTSRTGTERAFKTAEGLDPLIGTKNLGTFVTGLEYQLDAFDMRSVEERGERPRDPDKDDRLQNVFALKHYYYAANAKDVWIGLGVQSLDSSGHRFGVGDGLRFRLTKTLSLKASYELATRIPSVEELFGDSLYVNANLELEPETSHNVNAGLRFEARRTPIGNIRIDTNAFLREARGLIVALAETQGVQYKNVAGARILGVEGALEWRSPGNWVVLGGNATYQDARSRSTAAQISRFDGERIPNQPWLFGNWSARVQWRRLLTSDDGLAPFYSGRYVHEFFRTWESIGDRDFKATVPTQVSHTLGLTYWNNFPSRTSVTFEIDNLTDDKLYDFFGVQKPGRNVSVKVTGEL